MSETLTARDIMNDAFGSDEETESTVADTSTTDDAGDEGVSGAEGVTDREDAPVTPTGPGIDRGDGRDSTGKWVGKGKDPSTTEPAAPTTEPAPPVADEATTQATPAAPAEPAPQGQPWRVKVSGTEYETGATYTPGVGLTVPEEAVAAFQTAVQEGVYYKANWERLREEATTKGRTEGKALGDKILDQIAGFADKVASGDTEQQLEVLRWFANYKQELPRLQAEMERDQYKAQLESRTQGEKAKADEATQSQLATQKAQFVQQELSTMLSHPTLSVLTKDDRAAIERQVQAFESALWVEKDGEWHLDTDKLAAIAQARAEVRSEAIRAAKAAQDAAKFNKGATPAKAGVPAKTPRAAAPVAVAAEEESPADYKRRFKDEWRRTPGLPADDDE